jgi:hypothetical protein
LVCKTTEKFDFWVAPVTSSQNYPAFDQSIRRVAILWLSSEGLNFRRRFFDKQANYRNSVLVIPVFFVKIFDLPYAFDARESGKQMADWIRISKRALCNVSVVVIVVEEL